MRIATFIFAILLSLPLTGQIAELERLRQEQGGGAPHPPVDLFDPIVDLNASTIYNTGTTPATNGQTVETWGNAIVGNNVTGASQSDASRRPTMTIIGEIPGVLLDGSNDFLQFPNVSELDPSISDSWSWTVQTLGPTHVSGAMIHKGQSSPRHYGFFYFVGNYITYAYNNNRQVGGVADDSPDQVLTFVYDSSANTSQTFKNGVSFQGPSALTETTTSPLPALIGARQDNGDGTSWAFFYDGAFRRVMFHDKALTAQQAEDLYDALNE